MTWFQIVCAVLLLFMAFWSFWIGLNGLNHAKPREGFVYLASMAIGVGTVFGTLWWFHL